MKTTLLQLQQEIYNYVTIDYDTEEAQPYYVNYSPKLLFLQAGDLFDVTFYGDGYDDDAETKAVDLDFETNFPFCRLLDLITEEENADKLISLTFDGPDTGANGLKSWDFSRIIQSDVIFPNLKSFSVQLTDLGDHNQNVIDGGGLEENGMIAKLLAKMPALETLVVPSAPDQSFFEIGRHPLKQLKVQAGYGHQQFIEHFANSDNFFQLNSFDYTDLIDMQEMPAEEFTSFEQFRKLFKSKAFSTVSHFKLRNSILTMEQLFELQKLSKVQFLNIAAKGGRYVSHLMMESK